MGDTAVRSNDICRSCGGDGVIPVTSYHGTHSTTSYVRCRACNPTPVDPHAVLEVTVRDCDLWVERSKLRQVGWLTRHGNIYKFPAPSRVDLSGCLPVYVEETP